MTIEQHAVSVSSLSFRSHMMENVRFQENIYVGGPGGKLISQNR